MTNDQYSELTTIFYNYAGKPYNRFCKFCRDNPFSPSHSGAIYDSLKTITTGKPHFNDLWTMLRKGSKTAKSALIRRFFLWIGELRYLLKRLIIHTTTAMTKITRKIPTPIPAWKISPTSSHEVAVISTKNRVSKRRVKCFIMNSLVFVTSSYTCIVALDLQHLVKSLHN
jgi:hypothetical protein